METCYLIAEMLRYSCEVSKIISKIVSKMRCPYTITERMLELMELDVPYSANKILLLLGLKSKETLRKNYINPAIEAGLIRMTLPDKPNSKNQRYINS